MSYQFAGVIVARQLYCTARKLYWEQSPSKHSSQAEATHHIFPTHFLYLLHIRICQRRSDCHILLLSCLSGLCYYALTAALYVLPHSTLFAFSPSTSHRTGLRMDRCCVPQASSLSNSSLICIAHTKLHVLWPLTLAHQVSTSQSKKESWNIPYRSLQLSLES